MATEQARPLREHVFFGQTAGEFTRRLQGALQHELDAQRHAGYAIYGVDETEGVYTVLPDGRRLAGGPLPGDSARTPGSR